MSQTTNNETSFCPDLRKKNKRLSQRIISDNSPLFRVKSGQSNLSCIMCYDCGTRTHSLLHRVSLWRRGCALRARVAQAAGRGVPQTALLTSLRLHSRQTLLFLGRENERDE